MMQRPDDEVLCYLIDVALSETQDLLHSENSETQTERHRAGKHSEQKSGSSSVLHLLAGDKVS